MADTFATQGRDPNWQKGVCINLGGGHNSMGSFTI
jgi:hypothetical protein